MVRLAVRLAVVMLFLSGCGARRDPLESAAEGDAPSCRQLAASAGDVALASSGATSREEREYVIAFIEETVESTRIQCETEPWSPAYRRCVGAARAEQALFACDREAALARGEDLGGPTCEEVADHLMKVTIEPIGTTSEHEAELRDRFVWSCQPWSRAHKECLLAATTRDALTSCDQP